MPRPTTKKELLSQSRNKYQNLLDLINSFSIEQQEWKFPFEDRDKNIKDVLIHLYERHKLLLSWESSNIQWKPKSFLPDEYNWKTYPKMNIEIWEKHKKTRLSDAKNMLQKTYNTSSWMIESHTDEELFTKKYYPWTGSTSLGSYCISDT